MESNLEYFHSYNDGENDLITLCQWYGIMMFVMMVAGGVTITTKNGGFGPRFKNRGPKMPNAPFFKNGA